MNTEDGIKKSLVMIDDPICSLDENILFRVALLIHKNFEHTRQLIVLSHNFLFLKYFSSFFPKKDQKRCFFLHEDKLKNLPEEMKNFETPYFYMIFRHHKQRYLKYVTMKLQNDSSSISTALKLPMAFTN